MCRCWLILSFALLSLFIGGTAFIAVPLSRSFSSVTVATFPFSTELTSGAFMPSSTALFAHHPQMKIIKKKMHRRPKKKRLSDINRNNVNFGKCINKWPNAPPEYTLRTAEEMEQKYNEISRRIWNEGVPGEPIIKITEEHYEVGPLEMVIRTKPTPGALKKPTFLPRSGSAVSFKKPDIVLQKEQEKLDQEKDPHDWIFVEASFDGPDDAATSDVPVEGEKS